MRVLVVEDNEDLGLLMQGHLEKNGYFCSVVTSLADARRALAKTRFDFLILDLILPDGNGFELIPELSTGINHEVTVIISSGNVNVAVRENARIHAVFQKPFDMDALLKSMKATG